MQSFKNKLIARYHQTCHAAKSMRTLFFYGGFMCMAVEAYKAVQCTSVEGVAFEVLSGIAAVFSGMFINQWPDAEQSVLAFKVSFGLALLQTAAFMTHLKGDLPLPKEAWPLGAFYFAVCWGMDRYTLYSLDRTLKLIADLDSAFPQKSTAAASSSEQKGNPSKKNAPPGPGAGAGANTTGSKKKGNRKGASSGAHQGQKQQANKPEPDVKPETKKDR
mmetsp:Transcript_9663/g.23785  ORF Transcript_9663/g.23785 Transcript_9663/m.23785 type:complete len:218 (-) Transcript_9663:37-690(-)